MYGVGPIVFLRTPDSSAAATSTLSVEPPGLPFPSIPPGPTIKTEFSNSFVAPEIQTLPSASIMMSSQPAIAFNSATNSHPLTSLTSEMTMQQISDSSIHSEAEEFTDDQIIMKPFSMSSAEAVSRAHDAHSSSVTNSIHIFATDEEDFKMIATRGGSLTLQKVRIRRNSHMKHSEDETTDDGEETDISTKSIERASNDRLCDDRRTIRGRGAKNTDIFDEISGDDNDNIRDPISSNSRIVHITRTTADIDEVFRNRDDLENNGLFDNHSRKRKRPRISPATGMEFQRCRGRPKGAETFSFSDTAREVMKRHFKNGKTCPTRSELDDVYRDIIDAETDSVSNLNDSSLNEDDLNSDIDDKSIRNLVERNHSNIATGVEDYDIDTLLSKITIERIRNWFKNRRYNDKRHHSVDNLSD